MVRKPSTCFPAAITAANYTRNSATSCWHLSSLTVIITDPANNGGSCTEISFVETVPGERGDHGGLRFSMLRDSSGFYVTPIWIHRSQDALLSMGETRDKYLRRHHLQLRMSVDATRNRLMSWFPPAPFPSACSARPSRFHCGPTASTYAGKYEDKYKYSADFGDQRVWGWSSVGTGGKKCRSLERFCQYVEYHNGGPMKRELTEAISEPPF